MMESCIQMMQGNKRVEEGANKITHERLAEESK
jgi:hypothetical protein